MIARIARSVLCPVLVLCVTSFGAPVLAHDECEEVGSRKKKRARVPAEHLGITTAPQEDALFLQSELTLIPVEIDLLGAPPDTPWTVFALALNVRTEPSVRGGSATVVGTLPRGTAVAGIYYIVAESDEEWLEIIFNGETRYISRTGVTRPHPFNVQNIDAFTNLSVGSEIVNRWWAVPISYEPTDLVHVPLEYTNNVEGRQYLLRRAARDAVVAMIDAARAEGIDFRVASPYRSGATQTTIYQNNVSNNLAQRSSAPPGHSEHQLGTTTDFSLAPSGRFLNNNDPAYLWLAENAARFGFVQTYTAGNIAETGYIEEPWHWRYLIDPIEVARQEGIQQVLENPAAFGLFTETSIFDLNFGGLILRRAGDAVEVEFTLEISEDLQTWTVHERIRRAFNPAPEKSFLRLRAGPPVSDPAP
jgi:D-alanyl-D-alanine dipeptidase